MRSSDFNRLISDPLIAYSWVPSPAKLKIREFGANNADKSSLFYRSGDILYTSHQNLPYVFNEFKSDCVVVAETGDSGLYQDSKGNLNICPEYFPRRVQNQIKEIPSNFKHIFLTNCDADFRRWPQITPLPLGIQAHQAASIKDLINSGHCDSVKRNLLYVNFQPQTNPIRRPTFEFWRRQSVPWAKVNFNFKSNLPNEVTCNLNYLWVNQSYFTLCPEGNGLDSYRIWESLYLGAIPVVKNLMTYSHPDYVNMPIFKTSDMMQMKVTEEELMKFRKDSVNLEFLTRSYWANKINKALNIGNFKG